MAVISSDVGVVIVLGLEFKDGDLVRMSWSGVTMWEVACSLCGANNGEHGRVGDDLCPALTPGLETEVRSTE